MNYMSALVLTLLSIAAGLQIAVVCAQVAMHVKGVGFYLRSPLGTAISVARQWLARNGSPNADINSRLMMLWIAKEASRIAICDYFGYPRRLSPSAIEIVIAGSYALTYPVSRAAPGGGWVAWLLLVAITVLLYYTFAGLGTVASLRWPQTRLRLSYVFGTLLRKQQHYLPYIRDLIGASVVPGELAELALGSTNIGWWAKHYWQTESHDDRKVIAQIIVGMLKCRRDERIVRKGARSNQLPSKLVLGGGSD